MSSAKNHFTGSSAQNTNFVLAVLREELCKRIEKNPHYSQRAFARQLGVSHTLLSLILNGRRKPTRKLAQTVSDKLGMSPTKSEALLNSVGKRHKKGRGYAEPARAELLAYRKLSMDEFALITEWQHYSILNLLGIPDTDFTPKAVAERLGISVPLAKISMQRLQELDIIRKDSLTGKWFQKPGPIVIENTVSTCATRKFHQQLIGKSLESLENDPIEIRDHSSNTFAMHPKHIPYALKRIREFRRQLSQELESFGEPEEVYNLTVQIFPTSRRSKK